MLSPVRAKIRKISTSRITRLGTRSEIDNTSGVLVSADNWLTSDYLSGKTLFGALRRAFGQGAVHLAAHLAQQGQHFGVIDALVTERQTDIAGLLVVFILAAFRQRHPQILGNLLLRSLDHAQVFIKIIDEVFTGFLRETFLQFAGAGNE